MKYELKQKLIDDFGDMFNNTKFDNDLGDGWFELIYKLSIEISELQQVINKPICVIDIKDQHGYLAYYTFPYSEEVQKVINKICSKSLSTCSICGSEENIIRFKGNVIKTICEKCSLGFREDHLPDIQCEEPPVKIPIKQVGVQNVRVPIKIDSRDTTSHDAIAKVSISTNLNENTKGISMSRLHRNLVPHLETPLKHQSLKIILEDIREKMDCGSTNSFIKFEFEIQKDKKSPVTNNVGPQFYKCSFEGRLIDNTFRFFEKVIVQYASYCPCSASLSENLTYYGMTGFPHAQRCFAELLVEVDLNKIVWLEDLIELIETSVKTIPYPILKRIDEQEVAKIAARNPMFVEDSIRNICNSINSKDGIIDWIIKCTHEESIHPSDAISINWKGIEGGLNGLIYL